MLGFVALILAVLGLIHLYLWKRLVRDPIRPGWRRRIGDLAAVLLAVLIRRRSSAPGPGTRSGWPGRATCGSR